MKKVFIYGRSFYVDLENKRLVNTEDPGEVIDFETEGEFYDYLGIEYGE